MAPPIDLKQVGKLFDETLAAIRYNAPDIDALEPEAIAWLKTARYTIMRGIESAYYELERSRNVPMSHHPIWVNPSSPLFLATQAVPTLLYPYGNAFRDNLATLIQDCGFTKSSARNIKSVITVQIYFPARQHVAAEPPAVTRALHVEDEFSRMGGEGERTEFSATAFGRLLTDARGDDSTGNDTSSPSVSHKRRRPFHAVKEESESEGTRLRSATRSSSAATLRSSPANVRRSGRKRVKTEE
ncbi:hypothetical protein C8J57DRAFT_1713625 [Mycena rebaudengoi]|nr:hypothetical protein C8J57DRAFT_1713625 [Mycena rebaudengoi]